jgi:uncharacterized protein DUF938
MVCIAPWQAALGLLAGGTRLLRPDGVLFLYGPFIIGGKHTATTNAAFDADLKQRDPRWGVRDVDDIVREAMPNGLALREVVEMPANNLSLVLVKSSCRSDPALRERFAGNENQVNRQENRKTATFNRNLSLYVSNQVAWQNARTSRSGWIDQCGVDLLNCSRRVTGPRSILASSELLDFLLGLSSP